MASKTTLRRRLHLPPGALPHDFHADVRALLPLPLVPARDRHGLRAQRHDRGRPGRAAGGRARAGETPSASGKGQKICAARSARSRCGATTPAPATRCASCASARSTIPTRCRPTSTSSPCRSSPGSDCPKAPAVGEYYDIRKMWPRESLERRAALQEKLKVAKVGHGAGDQARADRHHRGCRWRHARTGSRRAPASVAPAGLPAADRIRRQSATAGQSPTSSWPGRAAGSRCSFSPDLVGNYPRHTPCGSRCRPRCDRDRR